MAKTGGLLNAIKADVAKVGSQRGKIFFVKSDGKGRVRFLEDIDDGRIVKMHDRWEPALKAICAKNFDEDAECPYCGQEGIRTRDFYCWTVWDQEAQEIKVFAYPANSFSPIPSLVSAHDEYGNLTERDYSIRRTGQGTNTNYSVHALDKKPYKNEKAKPLSDKDFWKIMKDAYPEQVNIDIKGDEDWDEEEESDEPDYSDMSAKELYDLCKREGLKVEQKKSEKYYINQLKDAKKEKKQEEEDSDFWDEDEDGEKVDYSGFTAKELYAMCKERKLSVEPKKDKDYYIDLLSENDRLPF